MSRHKQICKSCGKFKDSPARGLCNSCYVKFIKSNKSKERCSKCGKMDILRQSGLCESCYTKTIRANRKKSICIECGKFRRHMAKGLCNACYSRRWKKNNKVKVQIYSTKYNRRNGHQPMSENKDCASFLGCHIAEQTLAKIFKNVIRMPPNNPGYDFICNKGMKIDVKSATSHMHSKVRRWGFKVHNNPNTDYFLFLAFDNRIELNPLYLWLVPSNIVNMYHGITLSESTLSKWDKYTLPIDKVITCCDTLR